MIEKKQLTLFKVRDLRKKDQFKIDDAYLNGYARVCKPIATAVYNSLCRHAGFHSQKAFPSQSLIAYQHNISVRTVQRALKKLAKYNIILIEQEKVNRKFRNNVYTLLDKSGWKKIDTVRHQSPTAHRTTNTVRHLTTTVKCHTKDNKVIRITKNKDNKETSLLDKPTKVEPIFSYKSYLSTLIASKKNNLHIIGLYWQYKDFVFENKLQCNAALKRELRPAKSLIGYSDEDIIATMDWLCDNVKFKWVLETVHKFIDENLDELETFNNKQY